MARALRVWAINRGGKNSVRNLRYGPRTQLVRGIYPTLAKPKFRTKFVTSFSHQKCYNLENKKHGILENDDFFFGA